MKSIIVAKDSDHLRELVQEHMKLHGKKCDLNHIDVSQVTDMMEVFALLKFNGDISSWDVSNVTRMKYMFYGSDFNGDISKWDTSKVRSMKYMFLQSQFNQNISNWDVSNVVDMSAMFSESKFSKDLSDWKPYKLDYIDNIFEKCNAPKPYWSKIVEQEERVRAIKSHHLKKGIVKELNEELENNTDSQPKKKVKM